MMKNCKIPHVFAMDNLDWKKKTLVGGSFNATTAIIIENKETVQASARVPTSTSDRRKTLSDVADPPASMCYISAAEAELPGFSSFCADLHPHRPASIIGFL